jgi:hypothetical protein
MNDRILGADNRAIKRFLGVDTLTYEAGKLDAKAKEMGVTDVNNFYSTNK